MSSRRHKRRFDRGLSADLGPEDGLDPRDWAKIERPAARNRKALQLCRQIERTLHLALAGLGDPVLRDLLVQDVRPFPDSTRMLVTVSSATGSALDAVAVHEQLGRASGSLRQEIASAIHRRKMPDLIFQVDESGTI